ncbi:MAG: flagellar basal body L-ring protein FlgH [Phycisphaerae bacterium]|nr:flagellar basal body L-ring protein FlgH [Phycisphaerae bacterium]
MNRPAIFLILIATMFVSLDAAVAQSSSLWQTPPIRPIESNAPRADRDPASASAQGPLVGFVSAPPREPSRAVTTAVERVSLIAVPTTPARKFKVHDLVTIVVRQQKKYEADGKLDAKKQWDIKGKLNDWFRFYPGTKLGQDKLSNGKPGFDFTYDNQLKSDASSEREDKFTTKIQATIVDIKPNGNLVLEARIRELHGEEGFDITLTGVCRSEDVTADNSVFSTQIAEMELIEKTEGAVSDSTRRGWIPKILDWVRPF